MARGRKPRTWVKMDCEGILRGSINYLLPLDGQAVWMKMIALSEVSGGRPGWIEDNNHNGLPYDYIAHELHCTTELLELVIKKMAEDKAIEVNGTGSIRLVNFEHYQFSEYDRQRLYRQRQKEQDSAKVGVKKIYGEFKNVFLLEDEYLKLVERFKESGVKERIEKLSMYLESKGDKYKSHYATILTWDRRDVDEKKEKATTGFKPKKYEVVN